MNISQRKRVRTQVVGIFFRILMTDFKKDTLGRTDRLLQIKKKKVINKAVEYKWTLLMTK